MKYLKILGVLFVIYVGIVVLFESLLGYFQPADGSSVLITTTDEDGNRNQRVLSLLESDGKLYVAANHWPRAWYTDALANPEVEARVKGVDANYLAVPVSEAEHARLNAEKPLGIVIKLLTGFPPRYFVRLDPR